MRAYVIDSKEQDISYIPLNSFVYHEGCGFIKRKQTTHVWNDTDFERIYCTTNEELNPSIQPPEDGVALKDAECLRFVVSGAYDFEKGATITEIIFKDILGNKIVYGAENIYDETLSSSEHWNNENQWGFTNLYDNDLDYIDETSGPVSSTLFNVGMENYMDESEFHIKLTPEQMEVLDTIEISAGSPEGRVPQSIAVYAVFDKEIPETKRETLIFLRTFTAEVDGKRPAYSTKATQTVNPADPCADLFYNGMNQDGNYLIMNPNTGLLESVYCDFPDVFKADGTDAQNEMLCSQDPRSIIVTEDAEGNYREVKISTYFAEIGWICEFGGCEGLSNTNYATCIKKACECKERNEATIVKYMDSNFNMVETNISDYLASKNAVCENLTGEIAVPEDTDLTFDQMVDITPETYQIAVENGFEGTYEEWLLFLYNEWVATMGFIMFEDYPQWLAAQQAAAEAYKDTVSNLDSLIENTGYGTDGLITTINPATGETITVTATEYKQIIAAPAPVPVITTLNIDEVYVASGDDGTVTPPEPIEIEIDNVTNMDINNIVIMDSLNAISWHFEEEIIMVPMFDAFGEPLVDENGFQLEEPKNVIKVVIDSITMPEGMDYGVTEITISDGTTTQTITLAIREDGLTIDEFQNMSAPYTKPLKSKGGMDYQKKFEWDEPGLAIQYYGAKGTMRVDNISDKFEVTITPDDRGGIIVIKSLFTKSDIQNIHRETVVITDGVRQYNIELYITSHMRVTATDTFNSSFDLGMNIVDNGNFTVPLFYADGTPKVLNECEYTSYIRGKCGTNLCRYYGADGSIIGNPETSGVEDKFLVNIHPYGQRLTGTTFKVIDPYFNYANAYSNKIDWEDIKVTDITFKLNKFMTSTRHNIKLDKYRYYNSKSQFTHNHSCNDVDFILYNQALGLNLDIENPDLVGIAYGELCRRENIHWQCKHGGENFKKFRLLTGEKYKDIGTTNLRFYDIDSEINISVTTIQSLDLVLQWNSSSRYYNVPNVLVGGHIEIQLIHPWDNDWSTVRAWSMDASKCTTRIDVENQKLVIDYHTIGETYVYVSDGHATHKMKVTATFGTTFTPEWTRLDIVDTDVEWYYINLLNVQGTVTLGSFDTNIIEAELVTNTQIRLRNVAGVGTFNVGTTIPLTDTDAQGTISNGIKINILDHNKWFVDNYVSPDYDSEVSEEFVASTVTNEDGSTTTTYQNGTTVTEYPTETIIDGVTYPPGTQITIYPDGRMKVVYPDGTIEWVTSITLTDATNWSVTDAPEGVRAWIDAGGNLKIETRISGTHLIELTHTDGTVKYVNVYVEPIWSMDDTPIVFDNNDYNTEDGE